MKKYVALIAPLAFLSGCATTPVDVSLKPQHASVVRAAQVFVIVPQDKVVGHYQESTAGQQFGIIGGIIDVMETSSAYKAILKNVAPVHRATPDLDFKRDFHHALKNSGIFADPTAVQLVDKPLQNADERKALIASAGSKPVVAIDVIYRFDSTYHVLNVESQIGLQLSPQGDEVYSGYSRYQSAPISADGSWRSERQMIPLWIADGAKKYRALHKEGIDETVKMIRLALVDRPNNLALPGDRVHEFSDYSTQIHRKAKGKVARAMQDRSIVLMEDGGFYSVSTGPTFTSAESSLAMPGTGHGRVFFYRPGTDDVSWVQPSIYVNGTKIGEYSAGVFLYRDFKPGKYSILLKYEGDAPGAAIARSQIQNIAPVELTVSDSGRYFVKFEGYKGVFTKSDALRVMAPSVAEPEIRPLRFFN